MGGCKTIKWVGCKLDAGIIVVQYEYMLFWRKKHPNKLLIILVGIAVVLFWRGIWGLLDLYLFPGHDSLSFIASVVLGLAILIGSKKLVDGLK